MANSKQKAVKRKHRKLNERMKNRVRESMAKADAVKQKNRDRAAKAAETRRRKMKPVERLSIPESNNVWTDFPQLIDGKYVSMAEKRMAEFRNSQRKS